MKFVKLREKLAGVFALALIVCLAAVGAAVAGWDIPVLSDIAGAFGIGKE